MLQPGGHAIGCSFRSAPGSAWASVWCSITSTHNRSTPPARIVIQAAVIGPVISTAVILLATIVVYEVWRLVGPRLDITLATGAATARIANDSQGFCFCCSWD